MSIEVQQNVPMHVSQVSYRRIKNTGNYENEQAEIVVTLGPNDDPDEAIEQAKLYTNMTLGLTEESKPLTISSLTKPPKPSVEEVKAAVEVLYRAELEFDIYDDQYGGYRFAEDEQEWRW